MNLAREVTFFAADHLLTIVWVKATLLLLVLIPLRLWLGHRSAAARAFVGTLVTGVLVLLAGLQYLAWTLQLPSGPELVGFPVFLFRQSPAELSVPVVLSGLDGVSLLGALSRQPAAVWLGAIWLGGVVALLGRFALHTWALRRTALAADPMSGVSGGDGAVAFSEAVTQPLTFGWRRPSILLPEAARGWPQERLEAVLAHERAHVRHRDYLVLVLTQVAYALYWANPLVWWLVKDVRAALESACDDEVLCAGMPAPNYAEHLLNLARQQIAPSVAGLPMLGASAFRARMRAILDGSQDRRPVGPRATVAALVLSLGVMAPVAAAGVWCCDTCASARAETPVETQPT